MDPGSVDRHWGRLEVQRQSRDHQRRRRRMALEVQRGGHLKGQG